jgi:hypothetical protein
VESVYIFSRAGLKSKVDARNVIIGPINIDFIDDEVVGRVLEDSIEVKRFTDGSIEPAAGLKVRDPQMNMIYHAAQLIHRRSPMEIDMRS